MRRAASVLLLAFVTSVLLQGDAMAGGWWAFIAPDGLYIGIGESRTEHLSEIYFESIPEARAARDTLNYAYLVRDFDTRALDVAMKRELNPGNWWKPFGPVIRAGSVDITKWNARNLAQGTLHLRVPPMATGAYYLMVCDVGCRTPLADLIPARVNIVVDAATAQSIRKLQKTNARLEEAVRSDRQAMQDLPRLEGQLQEMRVSAAQAEQAVARLNGQVAALRRNRPSTPWGAFAGWFVAGGAVSALALTLWRRRKPTPLAEPPPGVEVPDDVRELTKSR